ncbi:MAG: DUF5348 domain-containing protein [Oscillospiraceae bacterium]|nr:DUF5348 domain-containing protein [Oscillospiraceae bacterium]
MNKAMSAISEGIGKGAATIKSAYTDSVEKKAKDKERVKRVSRLWFVAIMYKFIALEISEIFNATAKVIGCIDETAPREILLTTKAEDVNENSLYYKIPKVICDGEKPHISVIQDTANAIGQKRFKSALSPFRVPLECTLEERGGDYLVKVDDVISKPKRPYRHKGLGSCIGVFNHREGSEYFEVISKKVHYVTFGDSFEVLSGGVFEKVRIDFDGGITFASGARYPIKSLGGKFVRIGEKL